MFSNMTAADWCGLYIAIAIAWSIWEFLDTTRRLSSLLKGKTFIERVRKGQEETTLRDGKEVKIFIEKLQARSTLLATGFLFVVSVAVAVSKGAGWPYFLVVMCIADQTVIHNEK